MADKLSDENGIEYAPNETRLRVRFNDGVNICGYRLFCGCE